MSASRPSPVWGYNIGYVVYICNSSKGCDKQTTVHLQFHTHPPTRLFEPRHVLVLLVYSPIAINLCVF